MEERIIKDIINLLAQLFQKMHEAGYEWNAEKKELKLLITNGGDFESEICEQNPVWSEEDEETLGWLCVFLEKFGSEFYGENEKNVINWLKSLKERNTWKPSDEQITALSDINLTGCISYAGQGQELINLYNDLKKLKG